MNVPSDPLLSYLQPLDVSHREGPSLQHPLAEMRFIEPCCADTFVGM